MCALAASLRSDVADHHPDRALHPQHARLNSLLKDTVDRNLWKLLWMPPALPYTQPQGDFAQEAASSTTKRLVFSSWLVVPKAIAAVLSYEAERRMISADRKTEPSSFCL